MDSGPVLMAWNYRTGPKRVMPHWLKDKMTRTPYADMAARINRMKEGTAWRISRHELDDLPGLPDWALTANITVGFERVKESVVGSAYKDRWSFTEEPDGSITVYRKPTVRAHSSSVTPLRGRALACGTGFGQTVNTIAREVVKV